MKNQELVEGLPNISPIICLCERCTLGKMNRQKFEKDKATQASKPLWLMHSNLKGPFQTKSLGGTSYVLTFIDDFDRMIFAQGSKFWQVQRLYSPSSKLDHLQNKDAII